MESNVIEVQFLYAPRVNQYSVIVDTGNERMQMDLADLKYKYPMLCAKLGEMFDPSSDNVNWDMDHGDWECGEGTLHSSTDTCNCAEHFREMEEWQMLQEEEEWEKRKAIDEMIREGWSEEELSKLHALRDKIANQ